MRRWTTREIRYLEAHAADGCKAVAEALGRTQASVEHQARNYGLSLRRRSLCPNCGKTTFKPLSSKTGWCQACTKLARVAEIVDEVADMEKEVIRNREIERERQRLYSRKNRAKKAAKIPAEKRR